MRTTLKMMAVAAMAALGAGCGAPGQTVGTASQSLRGLDEGLPSCTAIVRPEGRLTVEDVPDTVRMIVRLGNGEAARPVCAGTIEQVAWLLDGQAGMFPVPVAASDPMPANGQHPADSDPMPADGEHPADSDPMPANGNQPQQATAVTAPGNKLP
jgi:hypothetical protein